MPLAHVCGNALAEPFGAHIILGKHMKIRYVPLAAACALMVAAAATTTAQAAAVTYSFGGTLGLIADLPSLSVGDAFTGSFTYETTAVDADPDPAFGFYPSSFSINVTVAGQFFSSSSSVVNCPTCGGITVVDGLGEDDFYASSSSVTTSQHAPAIAPQIDGITPFNIVVGLFGFETLYANDTLPTALALSSFNRGSLFALVLSNNGGLGNAQARGDIAFLTLQPSLPVPEASTTAMLALGLSALAFVRRRKSH